MKKLVTLMLALAMIISAVGVLAEADGKITIWTWDPTFNIKAMQIAKEMYLKDHPDAVIDIQEKLSEDIETAVIASNGDTSTLPDILLVQDNSFRGSCRPRWNTRACPEQSPRNRTCRSDRRTLPDSW